MALQRKAILGFLLAAVLLGGGWVYWFVSSHGFSAREQPTRFEAYLARQARRIATPRGARELKNPLGPTELVSLGGDEVQTSVKFVNLLTPHPQPLSHWERVAEGRVRG